MTTKFNWQADLPLDSEGQPVIPKVIKRAFRARQISANHNKVAFEFTLIGWLNWWRTQLRAISPTATRGNTRGEYSMFRHGDEGPFEAGNVYCSTLSDKAPVLKPGLWDSLRVLEVNDSMQSDADPQKVLEAIEKAMRRPAKRFLAKHIEGDEFITIKRTR